MSDILCSINDKLNRNTMEMSSDDTCRTFESSDSEDNSLSTRVVTDRRVKRSNYKLPPFTGEVKE